jgi:threonine aldolase
LAVGLARLPGVVLDPAQVQTNIVIFEMAAGAPSAEALAAGLAEGGVKLSPIGGRRLRAVTHYGIDAEDIDRALAVAGAVLRAQG